jgi:hypothetical protein
MKFLKGFGLAILGFLLSLSLILFGFVLTLNQTALNPDFVVSEIDKLDASSLAEELISQETTQEELPPELKSTLVDTIDRVEPVVKEQAGVAVHSTYDYLLGERQSPNLADVLSNTFLNSDFIASLLDKVDIPALAKEIYTEQLTEEVPPEMEYLVDHLDDVMTELEPWIKEQATIAADPIFDYLLGESQSLNVVISLEPVMASLNNTLKEAFLASPPPEYSGLPQSELEQHFDEFFAEFTEMIPTTPEGEHQLVLDETLIGTEVPTQIADGLAKAEDGLEQARQYVGYFQVGYIALIAFILLLILGIVLIYRTVRGSTRQIGITFLVCGIVSFVAFLFAKSMASTQIAKADMPAYLQTWLPQLIKDFLTPLEMYGIGLMAGGVILIIVSFVYKRRQKA